MRLMNRFAKAAVFALCASLMSSFAWAGAFDLPSDGKILTGAAQQTYISGWMHDLRSGKEGEDHVFRHGRVGEADAEGG